MTALVPFDLTGPLPDGHLLLEASAGTGKTWTIAALAARYVAELGLPVAKLLIITFSNAAADELRSRIYARFGSVADELAALIARSSVPEQPDPVATHLAGLSRPERFVERLLQAQRDFSQATIATIHSFCQTQLSQLGVLGDWDGDDQLVANLSDLARQCAHDEYLSRYLHDPSPTVDAKRAVRLATVAAASNLPLRANRPELVDYVQGVRQRFERRRRSLGLVSFDDLPDRLARLTERSPAACQALRDRFPVVLVDEFQDTDPAQWRIVRRVFVDSDESIAILIGDPKQSIYGFRSADLACYAEARTIVRQQATLNTNYRSEPGVTAGVAELFGNVDLGCGTQLHPVNSGYPAQGPRLSLGSSLAARVWLRTLSAAPDVSTDQVIADDVVTCITALLNSAMIVGEGDPRPLAPHEIAVLTRTRERGQALVSKLMDAGIPTVWHQPGTAQDSSAAADWRRVLAAIADPSRGRILAAAFGDLLGVAATEVLASGDESPASQRIHHLAHITTTAGLAAAIVELVAGLGSRLGHATDGGQRRAELAELGEYLLTLDVADPSTAIAALGGQADLPTPSPPDTPAVRVATMHSAKGLEFPVVLLPQVSVTELNLGGAITFADDTGRRMLYVGDRPGFRDEFAHQARTQARQEELRLLYVGLTRAKHLAVAWHAMGRRAAAGPLTALLARDRRRPDLEREYPRLPGTFPFDSQLVHISSATARHTPLERPTTVEPPPLTVASFNRPIDVDWRRTSYSGLTAGLHERAPDEPEVGTIPGALAGRLAEPSLMNGLPGGTRFGTLVHSILEATDWTRPGHLDGIVAMRAPLSGLDRAATVQLTEALGAVITTPLGGLFDGGLAEIPVSSRLPELDFDLPLGGPPHHTVADLAAAMSAHLPATDPLVAYPERLIGSETAQARLAGFLTGSIDAILQVPRGFIVVDYKTNRLPTLPDQELAVGHYGPESMAETMMQAHYPLQAILYCAALHRYLDWRLPGYDPDEHLGGVGYLFVRGMAGTATPTVHGARCGVFEWYPPSALVVEISELLGGRRG